MARSTREDLDRYFDYNIFPPKRLLFLGSQSDVDGEESGVNYEMFDSFLKGLTYLDSIADTPITIHMNTMGGDWYHGMAMFRAIRACRSHVTVVAWAYACSMGSIILQAADTRIVTQNCVVMIHDGSDSIGGDTKTVEAWAKQSERTRKEMYRIYLERMKAADPKMTLKKVEDLCSHDKIFSPEEAVEVGLADWVLDTFKDLDYQTVNGSGRGKKYSTPPAKPRSKARAKATTRRKR